MAMSIYKLLVLIILMNITTGTILEMYNLPDNYEGAEIEAYVSSGNTISGDIRAETSAPSSTSLQEVGLWGNAIRIFTTIMKILIKGFNPFPFSYVFSNPIDYTLAIGLMLIKFLLYGALAVKVYNIVFNKDPN